MQRKSTETRAAGRVASGPGEPRHTGATGVTSAASTFSTISTTDATDATRTRVLNAGGRIMTGPRDYRRVLDIEASLTDMQQRSERRAWHVAYAAVGVAVLSSAALAVMVPFYRIVPLAIEVDRLTGASQVIDVLDAKHIHVNEIQDKHWVEDYVRSRERYHWGLLQMDYDRVLNMSDDTVGRDYRQIYSGPDALDRQLERGTERDIRILSTTLPPDEPGRAVVHIERTTRKHGVDNAEPPQRFVLTLAYTYRPPIFTRESVAVENPFGFKVTAYSRDPEYTPAASPTVTPPPAATAPSSMSPTSTTLPVPMVPPVPPAPGGAQ
jgi:type IV secretion system protein VirB8